MRLNWKTTSCLFMFINWKLLCTWHLCFFIFLFFRTAGSTTFYWKKILAPHFKQNTYCAERPSNNSKHWGWFLKFVLYNPLKLASIWPFKGQKWHNKKHNSYLQDSFFTKTLVIKEAIFIIILNTSYKKYIWFIYKFMSFITILYSTWK